MDTRCKGSREGQGRRTQELKPSEVNHGNITPSLRHEDKNTRKQVLNHGGVTLAYAVQQTVLSLAALRRLRFPVDGVRNQTLTTPPVRCWPL